VPDDEVVDTPFGKFLIDPQDIIGSTLKAGTLWDGPGFLQPLADEYGELGTRGVTILDIGANIGSFSVWLARHGAWRVIAVEPIPETMRYLKANLDLNKDVCADRVIPLEVAAYSRDIPLFAPPLDRGNIGGTAVNPTTETLGGSRVQGHCLDHWSHLFGDRVSLIKVDAQGCDLAALMGLEATITRHHPAIVFEWEAGLAQAHGHILAQAVAYLARLGYFVHTWPCYANNYLAVWGGRNAPR
jgi:FkbM family methyltransferase